MKELRRYYRAWVTLKNGKTGTISFRADNKALAWDHADHWGQDVGFRAYKLVRLPGNEEPTEDFGVLKETA